MRKTPSYLKGLAEVRARAAGDMDRLQKLYDEIGGGLAKAQGKVASCDLSIRDLDPRLDLLRDRGELRTLACIPRNWPAIIENMESRFPNFLAVLDYVPHDVHVSR